MWKRNYKDKCTISECEDAKGQLYGIGMFGKNYAMLGMTKTCLADLETYPKQIGPQ